MKRAASREIVVARNRPAFDESRHRIRESMSNEIGWEARLSKVKGPHHPLDSEGKPFPAERRKEQTILPENLMTCYFLGAKREGDTAFPFLDHDP